MSFVNANHLFDLYILMILLNSYLKISEQHFSSEWFVHLGRANVDKKM